MKNLRIEGMILLALVPWRMVRYPNGLIHLRLLTCLDPIQMIRMMIKLSWKEDDMETG